MSRSHIHLSKIAKRIKRGEDIPFDLMNSAINEITDRSYSDVERSAASQISDEAGKYLESWALLDFISAKSSDEQTLAHIKKRKQLVSRMTILLPTIIELLHINDIREMSSATEQIYDCAGAYSAIESSQYSTKQRKQAVHGINSIIDLAQQLIEALDQAGNHIDIEFDHHKESVARFRNAETRATRFEDLRTDLMAMRFASQLTIYRDSVGERSFYVGDNKAKTHVVECAYRLALRFGTPMLKTTPGSDFSTLCSLILELATGNANESLAGAINKFARSSERQEIDEDEKINQYENSDEGIAEYESDNFSSVKASIKSFEGEEIFWQTMLSSQNWDDYTIGQISIRLLDARERKKNAMGEHGPFLVWASQMSRTTFDEWREESERHEAKILALAIELGQRTRSHAD
jgi:hypothetical protein